MTGLSQIKGFDPSVTFVIGLVNDVPMRLKEGDSV